MSDICCSQHTPHIRGIHIWIPDGEKTKERKKAKACYARNQVINENVKVSLKKRKTANTGYARNQVINPNSKVSLKKEKKVLRAMPETRL
jgi:hypothetical protein